MKKSKGFTLIELLAVIVIVGILLTIVGTSAIRSKKKANDAELKKQAKMLADLAPGIYSQEKIMNPSGNFMREWKSNDTFYINDENLINAGYLDGKIKSPYSSKECKSYIKISYNSLNDEHEFVSNIYCDNKYKIDSKGATDAWDADNYDNTIPLE